MGTTKTIILEIDVEEGDDAAVKELLSYLAFTKRIKKYLWKEKHPSSTASVKPAAGQQPAAKPSTDEAGQAPQSPESIKPVKSEGSEKKPQALSEMMIAMLGSLAEWKKDNKLIRLKALKGKGKFIDIACKIVSLDEDTGTVTVYDVDHKVVETVRLTEIEDITLAL